MSPRPTRHHPPTVVVCGATGYLGRHVVRALHDDGWRVRALVREPSRLDGAAEYCHEVFVGHATDPVTLDGLFDGAHAAFSSIGTRSFTRRPSFHDIDEGANLHLVEAAERAGIDRFVFVSILHGADLRSRSPLIEARERVVDRLQAGPMSTTIIRPTGFFNDMGFFLDMAKRGRIWMIGDGRTRLNPIHGADLAEVIRETFASDTTADRCVGGPDVMTQAAIATTAFEAVGRAGKVTRVPSRMVRAVGRLIEPVNHNAGANLQMFALMGEHDMVGNQRGTNHLADEFRSSR